MVQSIIEAETGEKQRSHQINLNRFSVMEEEFVVGVQLFFFFLEKSVPPHLSAPLTLQRRQQFVRAIDCCLASWRRSLEIDAEKQDLPDPDCLMAEH